MVFRHRPEGNDLVARERLDASYRNLDRAIAWVSNADTKALVVLAFQGAVLTGLAAFGEPLRASVENQRTCWLPALLLSGMAVFLAVLCFSLWESFRTLFPDITPRDAQESTGSPFFFATISRMPLEDFNVRMSSLEIRDIEREVVKQTHVVASIATRKFTNLKHAFISLGLELFFLFGVVIVAEIGKQS
jgi:Family of unknown function (DUF5706)